MTAAAAAAQQHITSQGGSLMAAEAQVELITLKVASFCSAGEPAGKVPGPWIGATTRSSQPVFVLLVTSVINKSKRQNCGKQSHCLWLRHDGLNVFDLLY